LIFTKNGWAKFLETFFTNSSGHPGRFVIERPKHFTAQLERPQDCLVEQSKIFLCCSLAGL
jgi:hypothetical protein